MSIFYIETLPNGSERSYDVYSRLLKERIIFIRGQIDTSKSNSVIAQMSLLHQSSNSDPITLYISSEGGNVYAGLAIYDVMQLLPMPVNTVCLGYAFSMASVILCAGTKGYRTALPNSTIMIHQPSISSVSGQASDIEVTSKEINRIKSLVEGLYSKHTSLSGRKLSNMLDRDTFMTPNDAMNHKIIDFISNTNKGHI